MSEWISIEDELPPVNIWVLACTQGRGGSREMLAFLGIDRRPDHYLHWRKEGVGGYVGGISHWMRVPLPPGCEREPRPFTSSHDDFITDPEEIKRIRAAHQG